MNKKLKRLRRIKKSLDPALAAFNSLPIPSGKITPEMLDKLESTLFDLIEKGTPGIFEVDIPTTHTFTEHSYVREGIMPKGSLIIGHCHKEHHHCVVLKGSMTILNPDRTTTLIVAPYTFLAAPGRKVGFMHEDVLMQNIHLTDDWPRECFNDIDTMEDWLYKRSEAFKRHRLQKGKDLKQIAA